MSNPPDPLYVGVSRWVRQFIAAGRLRRGDRLPSYRRVSRQLGVSILTVKQAMDVLAAKGIVETIHGKGTFVIRPQPRPNVRPSQIALVFNVSTARLLAEEYLSEMFRGIVLGAAAASDFRLFSVRKPRGHLRAQTVAESGVDAAILLGVTNEGYIARFADLCMPVVVIDNCVETVPLDYVVCDNADAGRRVVACLVSFGHRRIAYIGGWSTDAVTGLPCESSDTRERCAAYADAMREAGLRPHMPDCRRSVRALKTDACVKGILAELRGGQDPPTALLTDNAPLACSLISALRAAGVRVPKDLSVAAIAGADMESHVSDGMTITYNRMPFLAMGQMAVELLQRRAGLCPPGAVVHRVASRLVVGNSTAPPAQAPTRA